jgi:abequosyltransferase
MRLSVCIPTHNYGAFIGEALESIVPQLAPGIEVVVLDGGSSDDTGRVVGQYTARYPVVRYVRQPERGGIDRDLARSVELARGEYCWLLSADDALLPGAVARTLQYFERGCDVVLVNRVWCDAQLQPLEPHAWLSGAERTFDLSQHEQLAGYLRSARSLGALFSFMSAIGFRRSQWLETPAPPALAGTNYAHVHRLFAMALAGSRLQYVATPLVKCRGGTDSFRGAGLAARLAIDLRGYLELSRALFPDDPHLQRAFRDVVGREHPWRRWVRARSEERSEAQWREVERLLAAYGIGTARLLSISLIGRALRLAPRGP